MCHYTEKRGVGVANDIFMENEPEQTSYNTKFQIVERETIMDVDANDPYSPWENK